MNKNLTVRDPLADKVVTILVNLTPDSSQRGKRTTLVSIGVQGEPPVYKRGAFEDVVKLIDQAWQAFGVRQQVTATAGNTIESEKIAEVVVAEKITAGVEANDEPEPSPLRISQPPQQRAQNLSLF